VCRRTQARGNWTFSLEQNHHGGMRYVSNIHRITDESTNTLDLDQHQYSTSRSSTKSMRRSRWASMLHRYRVVGVASLPCISAHMGLRKTPIRSDHTVVHCHTRSGSYDSCIFNGIAYGNGNVLMHSDCNLHMRSSCASGWTICY
jgi:hypothetical protein